MACSVGSLTSSNSSQKRGPSRDIVKLAKKYSPTLVRGFSVGNTAVVDKKSWLEVCDEKHRYGANLRAYFKEWKRLGCPGVTFWEWLENPSVEVEGVPRTKLERETVLYCSTSEEREQFALDIEKGLFFHKDQKKIVDTGDEGWIFVLRDGVLYASRKETESVPRIHHTSFFGGECVQAAGMLVIEGGVMMKIFPHSGHYRPSEVQLRTFLLFLHNHGVDLTDILVDAQRLQKVYREVRDGVQMRKVDCAHFCSAKDVLNFLNVKEYTSRSNLFEQLRDQVSIRNAQHRNIPNIPKNIENIPKNIKTSKLSS